MQFKPRGRIIVSKVNEEGKGVFASDLEIAAEALASGATVRRVFSAPSVPVQGVNYNSEHEYGALANSHGVSVLECEMPPGDKSPMHATPSIDFGFMLTGEATLILDSGEETTLK
jgi:hypothetical protein